ncbi:MAG: hypothetical protein SVM86_00740, partial [Candidatus Cloacimonadota bacterium]|nr:hypothetical protein [Candidatus Cloacimonadota bacterium]
MKNNLVLILLLTPIILLAQTSVEKYEPSFQMPSLSGSGFVLNPSKLQMNHSVFFLGGVSSNNQGYYESTYTNHLQYKFNSKLKLNVDLNFVNFGTASFQDNWS